MLTKRAAWAYLSALWENARSYPEEFPPQYKEWVRVRMHIGDGDFYPAGLCNSINYMTIYGLINNAIRGQMLNVIKKLPRCEDDPCYKWGHDAEAARQRAEFCMKQAMK